MDILDSCYLIELANDSAQRAAPGPAQVHPGKALGLVLPAGGAQRIARPRAEDAAIFQRKMVSGSLIYQVADCNWIIYTILQA